MDSSSLDRQEAKKIIYDADDYLKFQVHRSVQTLFVGVVAEIERLINEDEIDVDDEVFGELRDFIFDKGNGTIRRLKRKIDNTFNRQEQE